MKKIINYQNQLVNSILYSNSLKNSFKDSLKHSHFHPLVFLLFDLLLLFYYLFSKIFLLFSVLYLFPIYRVFLSMKYAINKLDLLSSHNRFIRFWFLNHLFHFPILKFLISHYQFQMELILLGIFLYQFYITSLFLKLKWLFHLRHQQLLLSRNLDLI